MNNRVLITSTVALLPCFTQAAGFQLNAQSATGLGRAFSGDAVIADSAAVVSKNSSIDLGVGIVMGESDDVDESLTTIPGTQSNITADVSADALLVGMQYQYRF